MDINKNYEKTPPPWDNDQDTPNREQPDNPPNHDDTH